MPDWNQIRRVLKERFKTYGPDQWVSAEVLASELGTTPATMKLLLESPNFDDGTVEVLDPNGNGEYIARWFRDRNYLEAGGENTPGFHPDPSVSPQPIGGEEDLAEAISLAIWFDPDQGSGILSHPDPINIGTLGGVGIMGDAAFPDQADDLTILNTDDDSGLRSYRTLAGADDRFQFHNILNDNGAPIPLGASVPTFEVSQFVALMDIGPTVPSQNKGFYGIRYNSGHAIHIRSVTTPSPPRINSQCGSTNAFELNAWAGSDQRVLLVQTVQLSWGGSSYDIVFNRLYLNDMTTPVAETTSGTFNAQTTHAEATLHAFPLSSFTSPFLRFYGCGTSYSVWTEAQREELKAFYENAGSFSFGA